MRAAALHLQRRQHEHVDAEAGVDLRQLLLEQRHEMLGRAAGRAHAGAPLRPPSRRRGRARARRGALRAGAHRGWRTALAPAAPSRPRGRRPRRAGRPTRAARTAPAARRVRAAGSGATPQRLIETAQHRLGGIGGAEAALQGGARQRVELADAAQAEPLQKQHGLRREPQRLDGQVREPRLGLARGSDDQPERAAPRSGRARARRRAYRRGPPAPSGRSARALNTRSSSRRASPP